MNIEKLFAEIKRKKSFLCVGLDTALDKIPPHLLKYKDPVYEFNKQIIEATAEFCVSYKFNTAFYERNLQKCWPALISTVKWLPKNFFTIADAKRADIGNTAQMYAKAFLKHDSCNHISFNAITLSPYMGNDSIEPFLEYSGKYAIILALTSNKGSQNYQYLKLQTGERLFEAVIKTTLTLKEADRVMFVVGATHPQEIVTVRRLAPSSFLLVPGVGVQGGNLAKVAEYGLIKKCGLLVAISRDIIYASQAEDFAQKARERARYYQRIMASLLEKFLKIK